MAWVNCFFVTVGVAVVFLFVLIVPMAILSGALSKWTPRRGA